MNDNVRELAITPSMRQTGGTMVNNSIEKEKTDKYSSGLSNATKGFMGGNGLLHGGTDMTDK